MIDFLVFDMDGVLVDVSESYRETIVQTVEHFTGKRITRESIQEYKNRGGFNNDWLLSQTIARELGVEVPYETVVEYFNEIFFGGLMQRERWLPLDGLLAGLAEKHRMGIFTGRLRMEADITLKRFACQELFNPLICADDVVNGKPAPDGLIEIQRRHPEARMLFIGDTVDDARSASAAKIPFVGIAAADVSHRDRLLELFREEGAVAVVENINELPSVIPQ